MNPKGPIIRKTFFEATFLIQKPNGSWLVTDITNGITLTEYDDILAWYNKRTDFPVEKLEDLPIQFDNEEAVKDYLKKLTTQSDFETLCQLKNELNLDGGWQTIYELLYDKLPDEYVEALKEFLL